MFPSRLFCTHALLGCTSRAKTFAKQQMTVFIASLLISSFFYGDEQFTRVPTSRRVPVVPVGLLSAFSADSN